MALEPPCTNDERSAFAAALADLPVVSDWLGSLASPLQNPRSVGFRAVYAAAPRKLGAEGKRPLAEFVGGHPCQRPHWLLHDAARWLLVHRALERLPSSERPGFVDGLFRAGELGEQVSLLRTLWALPDAAAASATAVEACRTNATAVFEAIACENPYPARCFDTLAFNQMVVKAIFLEVSVRRIEGLESRIGPELVRMVQGLASERRAAGRAVPEDIAFISQRGQT